MHAYLITYLRTWHFMTWHGMAWHDNTVQYNTIQYIAIITAHYNTLQILTIHYNTLYCSAYITYIKVRYIALHDNAVHFITCHLHVVTCYYISLKFITFHYIALITHTQTTNYTYMHMCIYIYTHIWCFRWYPAAAMTALAQERMMNDCSSVEDALQLLEATPSVAPAFSVPRKQYATGFSQMCRPHQL